MTRARGARLRPIVIAALAAVSVAMAGRLLTELGPWYRALAKPAWQPPDWLFGPAWTLIFAFATASAATGWLYAPDRAARRRMVALFGVNALLNVLWSALFFHLHRPDWALAEVGLLWLSIALLMVALAAWSRRAAALLAPYLAWVTFAAVLNFAIVRLNGPFGGA